VIDLRYNQIGDEGMKELAVNGDKLKNLRGVDLRNNQIGDEGMKVLAVNADKFKCL
jgi:hypothetical protein